MLLMMMMMMQLVWCQCCLLWISNYSINASGLTHFFRKVSTKSARWIETLVSSREPDSVWLFTLFLIVSSSVFSPKAHLSPSSSSTLTSPSSSFTFRSYPQTWSSLSSTHTHSSPRSWLMVLLLQFVHVNTPRNTITTTLLSHFCEQLCIG